jgi:RNA polymerase sigma-32 factor
LVSFYAAAISKAPRLGREEEQELARRAGAGDDAATNRLVAGHIAFVIKIAKTYRRTGVPMSDLIQEGMIGLLHAVKRFNPERDVRLSTYAAWWIRAAMQDHVVKSWSLVRLSTTSAQKSLFLNLRRVTSDFFEGADALSDELVAKVADRFDTTKADVLALARRIAHRDHSLDAKLGSERAETLLDKLADGEPNAEERLAEDGEKRLIGDLLSRALEMLPDRERAIIRGRYFDEAKRTFAALGRELDLSKDRVRQLEARALDSLRDLLEPMLRGSRPF